MSVRQGNVIIAGGNAVTVDQTLDGDSPNAVANSAVVGGLNGKQATITGAATTIASSDLTANRAVISNGSGKVATSATTSTELGYLSGVTSAVQTQLDSKANVALDNLTSTGANISNWSSNVTNCITNIPQDIKLELSNGTLTLKAGSKVYVPNGAGVFDDYTSSADKTVTNANNGQYLVFTTKTFGYLVLRIVSNCSSGSSATASTYSAWYDTTNNKIKYTSSGTMWLDSDEWTLPIALVTVSGGAISSIDQVFNGFGYIGSTVFALPGVKGLIPDGRNSDGTLKNTNFTTSSVFTNTITSRYSSLTNIRISGSGLQIGSLAYDEIYNYNRLSAGGDIRVYATAGYVTTTSGGTITSFSTKYAFHAVDYSDTEYIAHQAIPSGRRVNLTLGVSGAEYTAPADGLIFLNKTVGTVNTKIEMVNSTINYRTVTATGGLSTSAWAYCSIPVNKGDIVQVVYSVTGTTNRFCFIYANGAK